MFSDYNITFLALSVLFVFALCWSSATFLFYKCLPIALWVAAIPGFLISLFLFRPCYYIFVDVAIWLGII